MTEEDEDVQWARDRGWVPFIGKNCCQFVYKNEDGKLVKTLWAVEKEPEREGVAFPYPTRAIKKCAIGLREWLETDLGKQRAKEYKILLVPHSVI